MSLYCTGKGALFSIGLCCRQPNNNDNNNNNSNNDNNNNNNNTSPRFEDSVVHPGIRGLSKTNLL